MRLALVTCAALPDGFDDDDGLVDAFAAAGADAAWAVWDDPAVDWSAFDATVLRSPWDYSGRRDEFLAWAGRVPRLLNPLPVVGWNTDKRYLRELAAAGLPVVETAFVAPGDPAPELDGEVVVKPAVSAGGQDTGRFGPGEHDEARAFLAELAAAGRVAMVQPYMGSVDEHGETALLYFGGRLSHAARKGAILLEPGIAPVRSAGPGLAAAEAMFADEVIGPRDPSAREAEVADAVVAHLRERFGANLPYARIDLLQGPGGEPVLLEAELTEPSLFFAESAGAVERFAAAVVGAAG